MTRTINFRILRLTSVVEVPPPEATTAYQEPPAAAMPPNQCYAPKIDQNGNMIKQDGNPIPDFSKPVPESSFTPVTFTRGRRNLFQKRNDNVKIEARPSQIIAEEAAHRDPAEEAVVHRTLPGRRRGIGVLIRPVHAGDLVPLGIHALLVGYVVRLWSCRSEL